jgi:hypothetical protein
MRKRLASEAGTAIVTAIALMTAMAGMGLAAFAVVDTQQTESTRQRQREGSFNYTEAALNTQAFILSRRWPGSSANAYPASGCTQAGSGSAFCPQPAQLAASYTGPDYATGVKWKTSVRDDDGTAFYDEGKMSLRPTWDQNDNNSVWVRSEGEVRGRKRTLVALVRIQETTENLPRRTVIAGRFRTSNNGNKTIVKTNSTAASPHPVTVRCDPNDTSCMEYNRTSSNPQIEPRDSVEGPSFVGQRAIADDVTERFRDRAIADGTFYASGCPASPAGRVVYVVSGNCQWQGNDAWNSLEEPGILIMERGTMTFKGTSDYYGILYHLNYDNTSNFIVTLGGANTVYGAIFVDGAGGVDVGSDKANLIYDDKIFQNAKSYGTAGIVQNSWREITAD